MHLKKKQFWTLLFIEKAKFKQAQYVVTKQKNKKHKVGETFYLHILKKSKDVGGKVVKKNCNFRNESIDLFGTKNVLQGKNVILPKILK